VESAKGGNPYLNGVLAGLPIPSNYQEWQDPAVQKCAAEVKKAYPSDTINAPLNPSNPKAASVPATAVSVIQACQDLAMVVKIADAAGKNLTTASFTKAGESLKNVTFPGSGGPVSFAPGKPYALGTVSIVTYSPKSETLVPLTSSAK